MLAATAKRSYLPKRQLFIVPRTEADSLFSAHNRTLNEWQLLTAAPNLTNDRKVVVSRQAGFKAETVKADVRSDSHDIDCFR